MTRVRKIKPQIRGPPVSPSVSVRDAPAWLRAVISGAARPRASQGRRELPTLPATPPHPMPVSCSSLVFMFQLMLMPFQHMYHEGGGGYRVQVKSSVSPPPPEDLQGCVFRSDVSGSPADIADVSGQGSSHWHQVKLHIVA